MKSQNLHTTNYYETFIEVADDCPVIASEAPPEKKDKTVARIQFELISKHPYKFTSDDVVFSVFAEKNKVPKSKIKEEREAFFSKGQPCLRSSPLAKRYGFGIHCNSEGKVALYPLESVEYQKFLQTKGLKKVKAMRSKRN